MNNPLYISMTIGIATALSCILPGTFLVLRGVALVSDAISHAVLPGIIIMFLYCGSLNSPLLLVGAATAGILTVLLTEYIIQTKRLKKDAAISLVFPFFFSLGVILLSLYARAIHLDIDMVLLGELAFAPFNQLIIGGISYGAYALWATTAIIIVQCIGLRMLYKELVLATFDPCLAFLTGFEPKKLYYLLIGITSITAVNGLHTMGASAVVALMIGPSATAYFVTKQMTPHVWMSIAFGITSVVSGYTLACLSNVSIAGSIATMCGVLFISVLIAAPEKGIYARSLYKQEALEELQCRIVCAQYRESHLYHTIESLAARLNWSYSLTQKILTKACKKNYITYTEYGYIVTAVGKNSKDSISW